MRSQCEGAKSFITAFVENDSNSNSGAFYKVLLSKIYQALKVIISILRSFNGQPKTV